eukprot:TRINITY_DN1723_c0_g1_i2.p1 TRINITY_DN1723_c0_g1~~TRINITY_DN1723_c0_g1_i2.p1  ORF type:complete len:466 (-),score=89.96 TRINITY_DN1723_c0_g1_i2:14-1411(-)
MTDNLNKFVGDHKLLGDHNFMQFAHEEGFLSEEEVLSRDISWDQLVLAHLSQQHSALITRYARTKGSAEKSALLEKDGQVYCQIFMILLSRTQTDENLQYLLTLVEELLKDKPDRAQYFYKLKDNQRDEGIPELPFGPLFSLLGRRQDWYINSKTCSIITIFLMQFPVVSKENTEFIFRWFIEQLKKDADKDKAIAVISLQSLLRRDKYRIIFAQEGGLNMLVNITRISKSETNEQPNFQLLYQTVFCIWCLSFNEAVKKTMMTSSELVVNLCEILRNVPITKVIRLSIATLRNVLNLGKNNEMMIGCGVLKTLENLKKKQWGDEDIEADLDLLYQKLEETYAELSTFDVYKSELLSEKLDWTPSHRTERFWRENVTKFEEDDFQCLRILKNIVSSSKDSKAIAVACWDIGEFVRFHPRGKTIAQFLKLKNEVMENLNHPDIEVKKEALLALQKLMVVHWEYLSQ